MVHCLYSNGFSRDIDVINRNDCDDDEDDDDNDIDAVE
jgi:hypothetical protein